MSVDLSTWRGGFFVTGTDTEIGKTYVTVQLIHALKRHRVTVNAMKPVASGAVRQPNGEWLNDDVQRLMAASGQTDRALMNPYCFEPPISPHLAARMVAVQPQVSRIAEHYAQLRRQADVTLVEGAGGWLAPLSDEVDMADLAQHLQLPIIMVVGMRLGCLNHARLTLENIRARGSVCVGWVANQIDRHQAAYADNIATLQTVLAAPMLAEIVFDGEWPLARSD